MASFRSLPAELILLVAEFTCLSHPRDLDALARCSRTCHDILSRPLLKRFYRTALRWAADHGSLQLMQNALVDINLRQAANEPSWTPMPGSDDRIWGDLLHRACMGGHNDVVRYLLDQKADVSAGITYRACDCPPMHEYVEYSAIQSELRYDWQPLHFAICKYVNAFRAR